MAVATLLLIVIIVIIVLLRRQLKRKSKSWGGEGREGKEGRRRGEIVRVMTFYCVLQHPESLNTLFFVNKRYVA